jgi:hypothetical protein
LPVPPDCSSVSPACLPSGSRPATGLVLYLIGAVIAHLRAGVLYNIAFPGAAPT